MKSHEAAVFNLMQAQVQPSEIRQMTWTEYLRYVVGVQEKDRIETDEPVSAREAQKRIRAARAAQASASSH